MDATTTTAYLAPPPKARHATAAERTLFLPAGAEGLAILRHPAPCRCGRMAAIFVNCNGRTSCVPCATEP